VLRAADNLATFMCLLSRNSGSLGLLEPKGPDQACIGIALPFYLRVGRDGVGVATRYGLDGLEYRTPVVAVFSASVQTGLGTHPAFVQWVPDHFPGGKAARAWR
jgi:hypothetical protein